MTPRTEGQSWTEVGEASGYVGTDGRVVSPSTPEEGTGEGAATPTGDGDPPVAEAWIPKLYQGLTMVQAKRECRLRGLGQSGYLQDCLERLVSHDL